MKTIFFITITTALLSFQFAANAQNWLIAGNSNITASKFLGTTNNQPLIIKTNNAERMRVLGNGNIGIGTATPENKLHIFKGSAGSVTGYVNAPLIVENSTHSFINILAPDASETGILFGKPAANTSGGIIYNSSSNLNGFQFRTNNNTTQMVLTDAGNLAIGTLSPTAKLTVQTNGFLAGIIASGGVVGIKGIGMGNLNAGFTGIYGEALTTTGSNYAVYGRASGGQFNAAGYFEGDVYANSYNNISDRKFKTEITPLKNSLQQLMSLKPSSYLFKKTDNTKMGLPAGKQIGLIADEVKQVFPELVKQAVQPAEYSEDRTKILSPEVKYESVNYIGLIPVLIASIQEQQKLMQDQHKQIEELREMVKQLSGEKNIKTGVNNSVLEQNQPNPFSKNTTIRYRIPQGSKGQINIYDQTGKLLKTLSDNESGQSELNGNDLMAGTYTYTLMVNGKIALSKQMLVIK